MRRWVASILLVGLALLAVTPARLPAWFASLRPASTLSAPVPRHTELRAVQTAAPLSVEPPLLRAELGAPVLAALLSSPSACVRRGAASVVELASRLPDQRESIRRVCRPKVPPDWPAAVARA